MTKTVLITGASRGIGRATAIKLSEEGKYNIVINYLKEKEKAEEVVDIIKKNGSDAMAIRADVSNTEEVKEMFKQIFDKYMKVDILVNNAGISTYSLFQDLEDEEIEKLFRTNVGGVFNCSRLAIPKMVSQKYGKIINVSSIWGIVGASCESLYASTKGAINALTKSLAKELAPCNIRVNAVAPGVVMTDMMKDLSEEDLEIVKDETPLREFIGPDELANTIVFLISEKGDYYTGQILSPNGGLVIN